MASSRHRTPFANRLNPGYLAPLTQDNPSVSAAPPKSPNLNQTKQPTTTSNSNAIFNPQEPTVILSLDSQLTNPNHAGSSDEDDDGGEDQDDESDSTDSSISTDTDAAASPARRKPYISEKTAVFCQVESSTKNVPTPPQKSDKNDPESGEELIRLWPEDRPLPYPIWDDKTPGEVHFPDVLHYEEFAGFVEFISQKLVAEHKYNTVENFIRFYRAYKKSKIDSLESFFREYEPPVTPCHYTCVGLAYEMISQVNTALPRAHRAVNKFYVVSCEEAIETVEKYASNSIPDKEIVEKEHVLACLKITIGNTTTGRRRGCLLLDPGYHVSRVVTVMEDKLYPHTGRFVQTEDGLTNKKEYEYTFQNHKYISWNVTETKKGKSNSYTSLIFVARAFLSGVDFAERRNLVYDFKSLLKRDPKGQVVAGLYFPLTNKNPKQMTIFFMENNNRTNVRLNVSRNVKETRDIQICEEQMGLKRGKLTQIMNAVGRVMHDEGFMEQILRLNENIVLISAEN